MCLSQSMPLDNSSDSDEEEAFDDTFDDTLSSLGSKRARDSSSGSGLSRLITLQAAEGYWSLNESLASILGRSLSDLKSSCPGGVSEVAWGTILALAFLETKCSSQRDEWELLSMKSEMWVQGQALSTGTTLASLTELAKQVLA